MGFIPSLKWTFLQASRQNNFPLQVQFITQNTYVFFFLNKFLRQSEREIMTTAQLRCRLFCDWVSKLWFLTACATLQSINKTCKYYLILWSHWTWRRVDNVKLKTLHEQTDIKMLPRCSFISKIIIKKKMYSEGLVLKTMYAFMCRTFNPHYFFVTSQLHETLSKLYSQSSIILLLKATLCFLQFITTALL